MKKTIAAVCLLLALMLTACGTSVKPGIKETRTVKDCTFTVDTGIWRDVSKEAGNEAKKHLDILPFDVSESDVDNMMGGVFIHNGNNDVSFNLVFAELPISGRKVKISALAEPMKKVYESINGCTVVSCGKTTVNGYDCLKTELDISKELKGKATKLTLYMFIENGYEYVISFGFPTGADSKYNDDFKAVLDTVSFGN